MATKKKTETPAQEPEPQGQAVTAPSQVLVNNANSPSDDMALSGHFVSIVGGEHEGRYGVYVETVALDAKGLPKTILVRTRDDHNDLLTVDYKDARPAQPGGR